MCVLLLLACCDSLLTTTQPIEYENGINYASIKISSEMSYKCKMCEFILVFLTRVELLMHFMAAAATYVCSKNHFLAAPAAFQLKC